MIWCGIDHKTLTDSTSTCAAEWFSCTGAGVWKVAGNAIRIHMRHQTCSTVAGEQVTVDACRGGGQPTRTQQRFGIRGIVCPCRAEEDGTIKLRAVRAPSCAVCYIHYEPQGAELCGLANNQPRVRARDASSLCYFQKRRCHKLSLVL